MLKTEMRNEKTTHIDRMSTAEMMRVMQDENVHAAMAIETELDAIAKAVDAITERMQKGGRLFYIGCGTSGRLGVVDASECPPTYGVPHGLVVGIIAGGDGAIRKAVEGAEDSRQMGYADLSSYELTDKDSVVGISVAGGASYVLGAFDLAKEVGALTVAISSNAGCPIEQMADVGIHPDTGAEVVTGSTRMKAGSAHKMILNMISTSVMIKLGHVYENLMINLRPSNIKLRDRMIRIVRDITGEDYETSEKLLEENEFNIRLAVDAHKKNM
jgi:N-acetylmuramic acid 6-phosphate etherase